VASAALVNLTQVSTSSLILAELHLAIGPPRGADLGFYRPPSGPALVWAARVPAICVFHYDDWRSGPI